MTSPSKKKGTKFEREVVQLFRTYNILAVRAWGSDGRSKGWPKEVDVAFADMTAQLKIRKRLPKVFLPPDETSCSIIREDYGIAYAVTDIATFCEILLRGVHMLNAVVAMIDSLVQDPHTTDEQRIALERVRELVKGIVPSWYTYGRKKDEDNA